MEKSNIILKKFRAERNVTISRVVPLMGLVLLLLLLLRRGAYADGVDARWPAEPSLLSYSGQLVADLSHVDDGYFTARISSPNPHKMKIRITKDDTTLTYKINSDANFEVFPIQMGSGFYDISLFENVSGKKYAQAGTFGININLVSDDASFYYPNQYVDYDLVTLAVNKAAELCDGKNDLETYEILCDFMTNSFMYDYVKAVTVKEGELPDIDDSYDKQMGVCQDLAAIMCCMLRSQGIPARLVIGYADEQYHAWTLTEINGKQYFFDPTAAINAIEDVAEYSVERYY